MLGDLLGVTEYNITVEGEPFGKQRPKAQIRYSRAGKAFAHIYTPSETTAHENMIKALVRAGVGGIDPVDGEVEVHLVIYHAIPSSWSLKKQAAARDGEFRPVTKPDGDNVEKLVWDALCDIIYNGDQQVVKWSGEKRYSDQPRIEIRIVVQRQDVSGSHDGACASA